MSYSRWIQSRWYTFWCVQDELTENRDTAIFEICAVISFTAKELRNNKDECLKKVEKIENQNSINKVSKQELNELRTYMDLFLSDVDKEYNKKGI